MFIIHPGLTDPSFPSCLASFPPPSRAFPSLGAIFFSPGEIFFVAVFHRGWRRRRREHLFDSIDHFPKNTVVTRDWTVPNSCKSDRRRFVGSSRIVGSSSSSSSSSSSTSSVSDQAPVPSPSPLPRSKRLRSGAKRLGEVSVQNELRLPRPIRKKTTQKRSGTTRKNVVFLRRRRSRRRFAMMGRKRRRHRPFFYESRRRHNFCVGGVDIERVL